MIGTTFAEVFSKNFLDIELKIEKAKKRAQIKKIDDSLEKDEGWNNKAIIHHIDAYIGQLYVKELKTSFSDIFSYYSSEITNMIKEEGLDLKVANSKIKKFADYTMESFPELRHKYFSTMGHLQNIVDIATGEKKVFLKYNAMKKEFEEIQGNLPDLEWENEPRIIKKETEDLSRHIMFYKALLKSQIFAITNGEFKNALGSMSYGVTLKDLKKEQLESITKSAYMVQCALQLAMDVEREKQNPQKNEDDKLFFYNS